MEALALNTKFGTVEVRFTESDHAYIEASYNSQINVNNVNYRMAMHMYNVGGKWQDFPPNGKPWDGRAHLTRLDGAGNWTNKEPTTSAYLKVREEVNRAFIEQVGAWEAIRKEAEKEHLQHELNRKEEALEEAKKALEEAQKEHDDARAKLDAIA